jgi:hypothetical protein
MNLSQITLKGAAADPASGARPLALPLGKELVARILAAPEGGGRGLISLAGIVLEARLPPGLEAGRALRLQVTRADAEEVVVKIVRRVGTRRPGGRRTPGRRAGPARRPRPPAGRARPRRRPAGAARRRRRHGGRRPGRRRPGRRVAAGVRRRCGVHAPLPSAGHDRGPAARRAGRRARRRRDAPGADVGAGRVRASRAGRGARAGDRSPGDRGALPAGRGDALPGPALGSARWLLPERGPGRRAAAVRYRVGDVSPELVATGRGHLADAILRAAADIGVPVWAYRLTGRRPPA